LEYNQTKISLPFLFVLKLLKGYSQIESML